MTDNWAGEGFNLPGEATYPIAGAAELAAAKERLELLHEHELAARTFFKSIGIDDPSMDAIAQLLNVFVPCLTIMCERGYDREGLTWREGGWRSQLVDVRKKFKRLWFHGWIRGIFVKDHPIDMINYLGFYVRSGTAGEPWGEWGEPE